MASNKFLASLPFVLRWEGGFVDNPLDPGGRTNQGVTQAVYDQFRLRQGVPTQDVKLIATAEVQAIYETGYWMAAQCESLASPLCLVHFDTAVNMGVKRAIRFLQEAVNCGIDGDFGPATRDAVAACDPGTAVQRYGDIREACYRGIVERKPDQAIFLKGWLNRLDALRREAGLPGFEAAPGAPELAEATRRIPDLGVDPSFDL